MLINDLSVVFNSPPSATAVETAATSSTNQLVGPSTSFAREANRTAQYNISTTLSPAVTLVSKLLPSNSGGGGVDYGESQSQVDPSQLELISSRSLIEQPQLQQPPPQSLLLSPSLLQQQQQQEFRLDETINPFAQSLSKHQQKQLLEQAHREVVNTTITHIDYDNRTRILNSIEETPLSANSPVTLSSATNTSTTQQQHHKLHHHYHHHHYYHYDQHLQHHAPQQLAVAATAATSSFASNSSTFTANMSDTTGGINGSSSFMQATSISTPSSTAMASLSTVVSTEYATVNYDGLIGVNATDPYLITPDPRSFALDTEIQILMCLFYGTLAFTAIASNMIVCYIVLSNRRMRTATNYFIVNLAVGDILMALLCIPFTFPSNLIFQYWPFGLSLCVIVSYSQANSVFISAYTMVAISIDKYLAIMYPMRLRTPKVQAKIIILVIWSLALMTSLPTALLSSLAPASSDAAAPTSTSTANVMGSQMAQTMPPPQPPPPLPSPPLPQPSDQASALSLKTVLQSAYVLPNETTIKPQSSYENNSNLYSQAHHLVREKTILTTTTTTTTMTTPPAQPHQEQKKYFCEESWTFWPPGKYYYSMALMILQFVLPLFVLVITYSRIVIIVWGKRMPGEENNARDARMARSKRKMIKMVIFCVIAFALTWFPFNALIVIGDMHPDVWERQDIMYIWFITHYLAMCHTITNPLIYIWMNNRFRAGFRQAIADLCRPIERLLIYLCYYCCFLGCCLDCSHRKYIRVSASINRKRARRHLTSRGSIILNQNHANNNNNATNTNANNSSNNNNHAPANRHTGSSLLRTGALDSSGSRRQSFGHRNSSGAPVSMSTDAGGCTTGTGGAESVPNMTDRARALYKSRQAATILASSVTNVATDGAGRGSGGQKAAAQARSRTLKVTRSSAGCCLNSSASGQRPLTPSSAATGCVDADGTCCASKQSGQHIFRRVVLRSPRECMHDASVQGEGSGAGSGQSGSNEQQQQHEREQNKELKRRKRGKQQSHLISVQMTSREYSSAWKASVGNKGCCSSGDGAAKHGKTSQASHKVSRRGRIDGRKLSSKRPACCPACRLETENSASGNGGNAVVHKKRRKTATTSNPTPATATAAASTSTSTIPERPASDRVMFVVDINQSSQSTGTTSAQTNTTSLAISPLNSCSRGANSTSVSEGSASKSRASNCHPSPGGADRRRRESSGEHSPGATPGPALATAAGGAEPASHQHHRRQESVQGGADCHLALAATKASLTSSRTQGVRSIGQSCYVDETNPSSVSLRANHNQRSPQTDGTGTTSDRQAFPSLSSEASRGSINSGSLNERQQRPRQASYSQLSDLSPSANNAGHDAAAQPRQSATYCAEHGRALGSVVVDFTGREAGLETDDDICDVFHQANETSSSNNERTSEAKKNGRLKMANEGQYEDYYDDYDDDDNDDDDDDDDDDEKRSLLDVMEAYEMVELESKLRGVNAITDGKEPRRRSSVSNFGAAPILVYQEASPSRELFRSIDDELHGGPSAGNASSISEFNHESGHASASADNDNDSDNDNDDDNDDDDDDDDDDNDDDDDDDDNGGDNSASGKGGEEYSCRVDTPTDWQRLREKGIDVGDDDDNQSGKRQQTHVLKGNSCRPTAEPTSNGLKYSTLADT